MSIERVTYEAAPRSNKTGKTTKVLRKYEHRKKNRTIQTLKRKLVKRRKQWLLKCIHKWVKLTLTL